MAFTKRVNRRKLRGKLDLLERDALENLEVVAVLRHHFLVRLHLLCFVVNLEILHRDTDIGTRDEYSDQHLKAVEGNKCRSRAVGITRRRGKSHLSDTQTEEFTRFHRAMSDVVRNVDECSRALVRAMEDMNPPLEVYCTKAF